MLLMQRGRIDQLRVAALSKDLEVMGCGIQDYGDWLLVAMVEQELRA